MKTWKQFLESKKDVEEMEELLGKDLDNDKEKGESKEHKEKVFRKEKKKQS
jgi:hypothetical protein